MPTALITGITGQDGAFLTALLRDNDYRVVGLTPAGSVVDDDVALYLGDTEILAGDLRDGASLRRALAACDPDEVYNLAGISSVAQSWDEPELTADVNAMGVLRLTRAVLDHAERAGRMPRILQASSAEIFGSPSESPQNEDTPLRPRNPYAVSKTFAHEIMATYRGSHSLFASSVILFNHESPLRATSFVTRKITRTVAAISLGLDDRLVLGDLDIKRDWGYAGDYVRAMWLALQHDEPGDYVVATGRTHSVRDFIASAFAVVGIPDWSPLVTSSPELIRPTDAPVLIGDASRARAALGWTPTVEFERLVELMVRHDIEDLSAARREAYQRAVDG